MAYSTQRAVSDGTLTDILLSIEYIDREDIQVLVDNAPATGWGWITDTLIRFSAPVPAGSEVLVQRSTALAGVLNVFTRGAIFDDPTMDENFRQLLYICQEAKEGAIVGEVFKDLNLHGFKLINVGPGTQPGDAINYQQYTEDSLGARNARDAALDAQAAAETAKAAAQSSQTLAQQWASNPENSVVSAGLYSSYHYSRKAAASEANALSYRDAASTSASNANTYMNTTLSYRNTAQAAANDAAASAQAADVSEANAASWAASVNLPSVSGNAGKMLQVNAGATGYQFIQPYTYYGIGTTGVWTTVDANTLVTPGQIVSCSGASTNIPVANQAGYLHVLGNADGTTQVGQEFTAYNTGDHWKRVRLNGTWGPWNKFATFAGMQANTNFWSGANTFKNGLIVANGLSDTPDVVWDDGTYQVYMDIAGSVFRTYQVRKSDNAVLGFPFEFNLANQSVNFFGAAPPRIQSQTKTPGAVNAVDFTIPSWAKKITISIQALKQTGAAHYQVQLNGITSGYFSRSTQYGDYTITPTDGFGWPNNSANNVMTGHMYILRGDLNYTFDLHSVLESGNYFQLGQGRLALTAAPSTLRFKCGSTGVFTAGSITVICEG